MEKVLIGAGGFSREIMAHIGDYSMKCFVDDEYWKENDENIFPLSKFDHLKYKALIAIGDPKVRYEVLQRLPKETKYFTFIHNTAQILGNDFKIGEGSIVCAGSIITTNVTIGKHSHINLQTTIGHDCEIGDYFTTAPGAKISGNCKIHDCVYIGTNASVKEKISIHSFSTIGMNAGVVKSINESGVYVGTPAKLINEK
jgi:sugar O-acyltransferase (sialic acid O-acetyltransferase NeuD family)